MPAQTVLEEKYHKDGSLASDDYDKGHIELRALMDEPLAQSVIGEYAKKKYTQESFFAWTEIQEFRHIPTADYRRCNAMHIYEKYIKKDAVCEVGSISEELRNEWAEKVKEFRQNKHLATEDCLDDIQHICFTEMYLNSYMPFKKTIEFQELQDALKESYNKVNVDDFEYIAKLGVGGFGRVVHVRKKSTGKHYAMKTQVSEGWSEGRSEATATCNATLKTNNSTFLARAITAEICPRRDLFGQPLQARLREDRLCRLPPPLHHRHGLRFPDGWPRYPRSWVGDRW